MLLNRLSYTYIEHSNRVITAAEKNSCTEKLLNE